MWLPLVKIEDYKAICKVFYIFTLILKHSKNVRVQIFQAELLFQVPVNDCFLFIMSHLKKKKKKIKKKKRQELTFSMKPFLLNFHKYLGIFKRSAGIQS